MELLFAASPFLATWAFMSIRDWWRWGNGPRPPYVPDHHGHVKPKFPYVESHR